MTLMVFINNNNIIKSGRFLYTRLEYIIHKVVKLPFMCLLIEHMNMKVKIVHLT